MSGKNINSHGWLKDPRQARENEEIGGGYFVFRRGERTRRIRPSQFPFEHATLKAAIEMARQHATEQPGFTFDVVQVVASIVQLDDKQEDKAA